MGNKQSNVPHKGEGDVQLNFSKLYDQSGHDITHVVTSHANFSLKGFWDNAYFKENDNIETATFVFEDGVRFTFVRDKRIKLPKIYRVF